MASNFTGFGDNFTGFGESSASAEAQDASDRNVRTMGALAFMIRGLRILAFLSLGAL